MAQERFMSNIEFIYQIIVLAVDLWKVYATYSFVGKFLSQQSIANVVKSAIWLDALGNQMSLEI